MILSYQLLDKAVNNPACLTSDERRLVAAHFQITIAGLPAPRPVYLTAWGEFEPPDATSPDMPFP